MALKMCFIFFILVSGFEEERPVLFQVAFAFSEFTSPSSLLLISFSLICRKKVFYTYIFALACKGEANLISLGVNEIFVPL